MIRGIVRIAGITAVAVFLVSVSFFGGFMSGGQFFPAPPAAAQSTDGVPADWKPAFNVFWEAWNFVHQDFYKVPDDEAL